MNAGKSTALLQVARNHEAQGQYGVRSDARIREGGQPGIGGNERYRQACGRCFDAG